MFFKNIIRAISLASILSVGACAYDFHQIIHDVGQDNVYAFGVLPEKVEDFQAGTLMMMGDKYWYVLQNNDAKTFSNILNADLSQRYRIFDKKNQQELSYIPIIIGTQSQNIKNTYFNSQFCLRYQTTNPKEIDKLTSLSFLPFTSGNNEYSQCLTARGQVYGSPKNTTPQYHFEQVVPIKLSYAEHKKTFAMGETVKNIAMVPVAVVGAVLSIPVWAAVAIGESRSH